MFTCVLYACSIFHKASCTGAGGGFPPQASAKSSNSTQIHNTHFSSMVYERFTPSQTNDMDYKHFKEILQVFDDEREYPLELDDVITDTARSGIVRFTWDLLKPLLIFKLNQVFDNSFEGQSSKSDEGMSKLLLDLLNKFDNPPFTIQRVCELIIDPKKQYKKIEAYMRAIERNLLVVSTQEPDLTWMKSPRLTQLLEERPKATLPSDKESQNTSLSRDPLDSAKSSTEPLIGNDTGLEKSRNTTDTPDSIINTSDDSKDSLEADTTPSYTVVEDKLEFNGDPEQIVPATRKRSSECESTRAESPLLLGEETGTVLQEADSTTTVESDQNEAMEIDTAVPSLTDSSNLVRDNALSSLVPDCDDTDVEASAPKRLKPSSPEESSIASGENDLERREESVVSSLLQGSDSNGQVQNASTGQSEMCLEDSEVPAQMTFKEV